MTQLAIGIATRGASGISLSEIPTWVCAFLGAASGRGDSSWAVRGRLLINQVLVSLVVSRMSPSL
jgi:hypothetical protein